MKTQWKILCATHEPCPTIVDTMKTMGFEKVKETPKSPTGDITATLVVHNDREIKQKIQEVLHRFKGDIQQITIS
jgi:hypothetical protein